MTDSNLLALQRRYIPSIDTSVTFLGFGALEIGRNWGMGTDTERPDADGAGAVLNTVLDAGINLIDTASAYHRSEERIGAYVSHRRGEYVLASKCGEHSSEPSTYYDFSYEAVSASIDRSLKLLKTDRIDLMQIHFGPDPEKVLNDGETVAAMKDAKAVGKIGALGASIDGALATRCILSGDFDVMQMAYNLADRGNTENIRLAKERGMGVLVRCGMGNGLFTPRVLTAMDGLHEVRRKQIKEALALLGGENEAAVRLLMAINLRFLYENDGISSVIVGSKRPAHVEDNIALLQTRVDDAVYAAVCRCFGAEV